MFLSMFFHQPENLGVCPNEMYKCR